MVIAVITRWGRAVARVELPIGKITVGNVEVHCHFDWKKMRRGDFHCYFFTVYPKPDELKQVRGKHGPARLTFKEYTFDFDMSSVVFNDKNGTFACSAIRLSPSKKQT